MSRGKPPSAEREVRSQVWCGVSHTCQVGGGGGVGQELRAGGKLSPLHGPEGSAGALLPWPPQGPSAPSAWG